jgi:hypothetical protein
MGNLVGVNPPPTTATESEIRGRRIFHLGRCFTGWLSLLCFLLVLVPWPAAGATTPMPPAPNAPQMPDESHRLLAAHAAQSHGLVGDLTRPARRGSPAAGTPGIPTQTSTGRSRRSGPISARVSSAPGRPLTGPWMPRSLATTTRRTSTSGGPCTCWVTWPRRLTPTSTPTCHPLTAIPTSSGSTRMNWPTPMPGSPSIPLDLGGTYRSRTCPPGLS